MEIKPIDTGFLTCGPLKVRVTKVESPTLFRVHIDHTRKNLDELLEDPTRRILRSARFLRYIQPVFPNQHVQEKG